MVVGTLPQIITAIVNLIERIDGLLVAANFIEYKAQLVVILFLEFPT